VLSLKAATGDDNTKWNFDAFHGSISSVTCPTLVVVGNILKPSSSPIMQKWRKVNTRLLQQGSDIGNVRKPGSHYKTSTGIAVRGSGPGTIHC
jgi:hypothetical protein